MDNSMINPSIVSLEKKVNNRYALVVIAAKRARQIIAGDSKVTDFDSKKPLTLSIHEINEDKLEYENLNTEDK
ncbi:MAG TPA: DNA-directed RNA polymerase subunit omega [Clostridiaceae bacterium]|nr:DNA-directed RNA polymerase subunit omega [Clostridiaceae bacterium]